MDDETLSALEYTYKEGYVNGLLEGNEMIDNIEDYQPRIDYSWELWSTVNIEDN